VPSSLGNSSLAYATEDRFIAKRSSCLDDEKQLGKLEPQPCDNGEFVEFKQSARTALERKFKMISAEHSVIMAKMKLPKKPNGMVIF